MQLVDPFIPINRSRKKRNQRSSPASQLPTRPVIALVLPHHTHRAQQPTPASPQAIDEVAATTLHEELTHDTPRSITKGLRTSLIIGSILSFGGLLAWSLLTGQRTVTWLTLLGMNVVGTVGFNLLLRRSSLKKVDKWFTATVMQTGLFLPFLVKEVVSPIHFPNFTPNDFLLLGIAVVSLIALHFCNVKALQYLEASVFSVIYNTRILFATLFGTMLLGEAVGTWALIGGLLIFLAIFLIRQKGAQGVTKHGIAFGIGAALSMSVMNTCEKALIKAVGYEQYIFPMFTIAALIMWGVVLMRRTKAPFGLLIQPQNVALMALRGCAGIGFSYALVFGPMAVSSYLSSLSVVLLVALGMIFLGERDYVQAKLTATGVAIAGLTLIMLDGM
jgi:drug/metabolite transporter (DMT)-like permease